MDVKIMVIIAVAGIFAIARVLNSVVSKLLKDFSEHGWSQEAKRILVLTVVATTLSWTLCGSLALMIALKVNDLVAWIFATIVIVTAVASIYKLVTKAIEGYRDPDKIVYAEVVEDQV